MLEKKVLDYYKSERDIELISHVPGVITCENYCKWYSLYYVDKDGNVNKLDDLFDDFYDEVNCLDHSFEPASLVKFAIKHNLSIGLESYKAICYMYAEYGYDGGPITAPHHLPTMKELNLVLVEDYGDWSKCFSYPVLVEGFKIATDYGGNYDYQEELMTFENFKVFRVNDFMYSVYYDGCGDGIAYMIDDLTDLGDAITAIINDTECIETVGYYEFKRDTRLTKIEDDWVPKVEYLMENLDLAEYFIPTFIDVFKEHGKFEDGMVVSFPLAVCRFQTDYINKRRIDDKEYFNALVEFNKLKDRRYLTISSPKQNIFEAIMVNLSEIVGRIIGIVNDRIYVTITNSELLNTVVDANNLYKISAGLRYIGATIRMEDDIKVVGAVKIVAYDLVERRPGNEKFYLETKYRL